MVFADSQADGTVLTITVNGQSQSWTFGGYSEQFVPFAAGQENSWSWSINSPEDYADNSGSGTTAGCEVESPSEPTEPSVITDPAGEEPPDSTATTLAPEGSEPVGGETSTTDAMPDSTEPPSDEPVDTTPPPEGVQFAESFETPEGFFDRFQMQVFQGNPTNTDFMEWMGDHNMECAGPDTTRPVLVSDPEGMFWWCAPGGPETGHVMTSMFTTSYAHVDFAPNQTFTDVSRVCWDQNQTEMGGRKWTQVVVVPEATYQANGGDLNYVNTSLQDDVAVDGIRLTDDVFMLEMARGSTATHVGQDVESFDTLGFTTDDKAQRFRTCVTDLGNGTVQIELERDGGTEVRIQPGWFPDGASRVIFQDVTYDSAKGEGAAVDLATWHWDNIEIS